MSAGHPMHPAHAGRTASAATSRVVDTTPAGRTASAATRLLAHALLAAQLVACRPAASAAPASETRCDGTISEAAFLAGAWQGDGVEERWTDGAGGMMLGVGRTISAGRVTGFEFMRIEVRADGPVFIAQPSGGAPVEFRRTRCEAGLLRFENPAHDFPRSVEYRRTGPHELTAVTRGAPSDAAIEFVYRRAVAR